MTFNIGEVKVFIDRKDFKYISRFNWSLSGGKYPITAYEGKCVGIGPLLLGFPQGIVDHIDGNPLNNRRSNLRVCNANESAMNRGKWGKKKIPYKGVHLDRKRNKYRAMLTSYGTKYQSKRFDSMEEAAKAYDKLCKKHHGLFARTNFP